MCKVGLVLISKEQKSTTLLRRIQRRNNLPNAVARQARRIGDRVASFSEQICVVTRMTLPFVVSLPEDVIELAKVSLGVGCCLSEQLVTNCVKACSS
jgi:hypothetical protein